MVQTADSQNTSRGEQVTEHFLNYIHCLFNVELVYLIFHVLKKYLMRILPSSSSCETAPSIDWCLCNTMYRNALLSLI